MTENIHPKKPLVPFLGGALAIAFWTFAVYWPALKAGFIWDDDVHVTGNQALHNLYGLKRIWFELGATQQYYPMVYTTFWFEYHLWGLHALGFHLVNILLHISGALLLWRLLVRLEMPGAWLAAAVFALHPVHVESVAWVTERKNVLSGVFYFAAALAYLRFESICDAKERWRERTAHLFNDQSVRWYVAALVLFVAALFSKTVTCSLPAALLLVRWWKQGRLDSRDVLQIVPFFAVGISLGLLTAHIERHDLGAQGTDWAFTFVERLLIAGRALWFYAAKLLYPAKLTFIYPRWVIDASQAWQWLFPVAAVGVILALWFRRRSWGRGPLVAVLFFCGTLFPALGFVNVYPMRFSFVADHFQYLASVGLIALAAAGLERALRTGGIVWLLILGLLTWRQTHIYEGPVTLWQDTLAKNSNCWMAYNNLGNILLENGHAEEAANHYGKALQILPTYADAQANLGNILFGQGRVDEAIACYRKATATNATISISATFNNANYRYSLGLALRQKGELDEALAHFREAVAMRPVFAEAQFNLGELLLLKGQVDEAVGCYQKALEIQPSNTAFRRGYSEALSQQEQLHAAKTESAATTQVGQNQGNATNAELPAKPPAP
jgi:protein O-mannosyl-transferase